ncbi:hypothetical protein ACHAWT_010371 [Skeletonema menzelii]
MVESLAAELASCFIESSLGFDSEQSKLNSLQKIRHSLEQSTRRHNDNDNDTTATTTSAAQSWMDLMEGTNEESAMLRDTFIKSLLENCHPNEEGNENMEEEDDEIVFELIETSFACLASLITLRCNDDSSSSSNSATKGKKNKKKKKKMPTPLFGEDFVTTIATDVVQALQFVGDNQDTAVKSLLLALLRVDRPRNEMCLAAVRDLILLPASSSSSSDGTASNESSVACVAQVLSKSIISGVIISVPGTEGMDEEELSMRRETAVLNHLQDMRDVFMNVASVCSSCLLNGDNDGDSNAVMRMLDSIQEVYDIAEFAVESQLETLLNEKASPILSRLTKKKEASPTQPATTTTSSPTAGDYGMEEEFDGHEAQLSHLYQTSNAATTMKPIYAKLAKAPVPTTPLKQLESDLTAITDKLNNGDPELWDERLDALVHLECILAGDVASISSDVRQLFIEKIRKMPMPDQLNDLRSQITHQACRCIIAFLFEFRDYIDQDPQLHQSVAHFVDCCIPAILNLCGCAQSKIMSTSGMNCMMCLAAVGGTAGFPRVIPKLCDEILGGKKVHKNRKIGSIMALTTAVNVWESACLVKHVDQLAKAVKEALTNSDPGVREEGRKFFWAMFACDETVGVVERMFDGRSREMKNLNKVRDDIDAEWEEDGVMVYLVENGVLQTQGNEESEKKTANSNSKPSSKNVQPKKTQKSVNSKRPAPSTLKAKYGTPFKSQKCSTPQQTVKCRPPLYSGTPTMNGTPQKLTSQSRSEKGPVVKAETTTPRSLLGSLKKKTVQINEEKENSPRIHTPLKLSTPSSVMKKSPMMGSPVVNLLARASPLSAEKIQKSGDVLGEVINMLSDTSSPQEQVLGIKALALFAKDSPNDPSWEQKFSLVLQCLIDQIRGVPSRNADVFARVLQSPPKQLNSCQQVQHLFLQGIRSLLQFVPRHVHSDDVRIIVRCLLECTEKAPFEVVHTAEQALQNLICGNDPEVCFEELLPYTTGAEVEEALQRPRCNTLASSISNPSKLLSTLRTMRYLIDKVSIDSLRNALPSLMQLFQTTLSHASVDLRKATVFNLVEMHFVLGDELILDDFTDSQKQLVGIYIKRHNKTTPSQDQRSALQPIAA